MILSDISIHIYVSKILPRKLEYRYYLPWKSTSCQHSSNGKRYLIHSRYIVSLRPDNALLGRESNPPENETLLPIVANDTMHIKCNNGPSFYPCIGCQILLLKMSLNHSFIKPAFSWHTSCRGTFIGSRVFLRWKGYDKQDLEKKNVESCFKCF